MFTFSMYAASVLDQRNQGLFPCPEWPGLASHLWTTCIETGPGLIILKEALAATDTEKRCV
jgi:hypothetical protein